MSRKFDFKELITNNSFLKIDSALRSKTSFNIFTATGIELWEIRHTKFLSYLLNPANPHELKADFLSQFLHELGLPSEIIKDFSLLEASVFSEKTIGEKREGQIDIIMEIPSMETWGQNHVIVIENKIKSTQSHDQLKKYREITEKKYGTQIKSIHYFFLTKTDEEPEDELWVNVLYKNVVERAVSSMIDRKIANDFLEAILKNYLDIFKTEKECEIYAKLIDKKLVESLQKMTKEEMLSADYLDFKNTFPYAIEFLENFKIDSRRDNDLKSYFESEFDKILKLDNCILYREESSKGAKYLRIGFLNDDNLKIIKIMSIDPIDRWLNNGGDLVVELNIDKFKNLKNIYVCKVYVKIGSFNKNFRKYRQNIYNTIQYRKLLAPNLKM